MPSELIFVGNVFSMIFTSIFLQSLKGVRAGLNYASEGEFEFSTKVGGLSSDAGQSPTHHQNQKIENHCLSPPRYEVGGDITC